MESVWPMVAVLGMPPAGFAAMVVRSVGIAHRTKIGQDFKVVSTSPLFRYLRVLQCMALIVGFAVYWLALNEPAVYSRGIWDGGDVINGWWALALGFPCWGLNVWFLASPLILLWIGSVKDLWLQIIALATQIGCSLAVDYVSATVDRNGHIGEYPGTRDWRAAFWILVFAYALPVTLGSFVKKRRILKMNKIEKQERLLNTGPIL